MNFFCIWIYWINPAFKSKIDDVPEKPESDESERDHDVLVKDSTVSKPAADLKSEIKKPDTKLLGKIDLEKIPKPKAVPQKEEPAVKTAAKTTEGGKKVKSVCGCPYYGAFWALFEGKEHCG